MQTNEIDIKTVFPDWVKNELKEYCCDYPHLQTNWKFLCDKLQTSCKSIILVSDIDLDRTSEKNKICEELTRNGFIVRRETEFFPCKVCNHAIPSFELWKNFKNKNLKVPESWSETCFNCI